MNKQNTPHRYEAIFFDFDGTLIDTVEDIKWYANRALQKFGFETKSLDDVKCAIGRGLHELFGKLEPGFSKKQKELNEAVALFKKEYSTRPVIKTAPFPGVREMLSGPLKSFKKGVVTNKPEAMTRRILEELGLRNFFEVIVGEREGLPAKPDPTGLNEALAAARVLKDKAILIGDSLIDFETAQNAQVDFAWVSYGYDKRNPPKGTKTFASAFEWSDLAG